MLNELYFFEYEKKENELFGEFFLKKSNFRNLIATLLIDKNSKKIKSFNVVANYYSDNGSLIDDKNLTKNYKNLDIKKFVSILIEKTRNEDFNKNFCTH